MTADSLALIVALIASLTAMRAAVKILYRKAVVRAKQWVAPKEPTRLDVFMSELGHEVGYWRFTRVALIAVLAPTFFLLTYTFIRSVASSLGM
jgi:hypothetical protein